MKLTQKTAVFSRNLFYKQQGDVCALCKQPIKNNPHLDHCHKTGYVRGTLHKDCNILLGKIENYIKSMGKELSTENRLGAFLQNAFLYLEADYSSNPIYYTHKTEDEKRLRKNKRARAKYKKEKQNVKSTK